MSQSAGAFGQQALEFIEEVDRVGSPAVVVETVYRVLKGLGFEGLFFAELDPRPIEKFDDFVLASRCPAAFVAEPSQPFTS
jgi:hypothetical protein